MTREELITCEELFTLAKKQYYAGIIDRKNYLETLLLVKQKIKLFKKGFDKNEFLKNSLKKPINEVNIKETINFVLAMN